MRPVPEGIRNQTDYKRILVLMNLWLVRKSKTLIRVPQLGKLEQRVIFTRKRNAQGIIEISETIIGGFVINKGDGSKNRIYIERWDDVNEFDMVFTSIDEILQQVVIAFMDPFNALAYKKQWAMFLKQIEIKNNQIYNKLLKKGFLELQKELERKGMVKRMKNEKSLHGWKAIAGFLNKSIPTTKMLARKYKAPMTLLGGNAYSTEEKILKWLNSLVVNKPYYKEKTQDINMKS